MDKSVLGISIQKCRKCEKYNKGVEIYQMFSWGDNAFKAIQYDKEKNEILLCEDDIMHIIQMVNPFQDERPIRLIGRKEFYERLIK